MILPQIGSLGCSYKVGERASALDETRLLQVTRSDGVARLTPKTTDSPKFTPRRARGRAVSSDGEHRRGEAMRDLCDLPPSGTSAAFGAATNDSVELPEDEGPPRLFDVPMVPQHPRVAGFRIQGLKHRRKNKLGASSCCTPPSCGTPQLETQKVLRVAQPGRGGTIQQSPTEPLAVAAHSEDDEPNGEEQASYEANALIAGADVGALDMPNDSCDFEVDASSGDKRLPVPASVQIQTDEMSAVAGREQEQWQRLVVVQRVDQRQVDLSRWRAKSPSSAPGEAHYLLKLRHNFPGQHLLDSNGFKAPRMARAHDVSPGLRL